VNKFKKDELVYNFNDHPYFFYIVKSGRFSVLFDNNDRFTRNWKNRVLNRSTSWELNRTNMMEPLLSRRSRLFSWLCMKKGTSLDSRRSSIVSLDSTKWNAVQKQENWFMSTNRCLLRKYLMNRSTNISCFLRSRKK